MVTYSKHLGTGGLTRNYLWVPGNYGAPRQYTESLKQEGIWRATLAS